MKVCAIRPYSGPLSPDGMVRVYDLTVADTHTYCVHGVVVSNSKRVSMLDVNAMISHGALETLRDAGAIRGQANEVFWLQLMQGHVPTHVKIPQRYEKFVAQLKGAGINVVREGNKTNIMALTNKDVHHLAGDRVISSGETVRFDHNLRPIPGGLFDPQLTGGHGGRQWSKIKLHEPLPNPVMEEPIRRILGLTQKKMEAILSGDEKLNQFGSGPEAIAKALQNINLDKELIMARAQARTATRSKRDEAWRKVGYLKSAKELDIHPQDWVLDHVPVLPPLFRPVSMMGQSGMPLVSDANYLYKELLTANKNLGEMKQEVGHEGVGPERLALYHAFKAVTGLADPVHPKLQEKGVKGLLKSVFGTSPKFGSMQRKLLSSTVDNVGRAVVAPDPDLDMDSVGLPEDKAFDVYGKFIAKRLHRRGMPLTQALQHIKDRSELAREVLQEEMKERPVFVNRAPVLHRFGIMGFRPHLVKGDVLKVSPLIVKGFNMDFDGDTAQFHVPTSQEAVREVYDRMLPSKNLLSPANFKSPMHAPGQEYLGGLYEASTADSGRRPRVFRSKKDALAAYERGEIAYHDPIHVLED